MRVPQLGQGGVGLLCRQLLQAGFPATRDEQGLATALMRLGLQGAAFLELLPNPAHCRNTETEELGNLIGAFALLVEVDDSFTDRQRNHFGMTLPSPISPPFTEAALQAGNS